MFNIASLQSKC